MAAYKDEERGTWYVSFHYNDWTGKNKRKLKRGFKTRKEALEWEQKFRLQQANNLDMDFGSFYKIYEDDLKPKLKLNTWKTKNTIFQNRILPYFQDKKMNEISPAEIIIQCGDKDFWEAHADKKDKMYYVYNYTLGRLKEILPGFKVANAVIHFDEASPHMHVVGVPVHEGYKKGLSKRVSKRNVFTQESMSLVIQGQL